MAAAIGFALRQADTGTVVAQVCRKMGISKATFYTWKKKYSGLGVPELRRLRQLEEENQHLKQCVEIYVGQSLKGEDVVRVSACWGIEKS